MDSDCFGIGVDIESVVRFDKYSASDGSAFLKKIFTRVELDYCFSKEYPAQHLAARFAAKEAMIKALNSMGVLKIRFADIEIHNDKNGVPAINFSNYGSHKYTAKVSLSHSKEYAIAFVIIMETTDHD